MAKTQTDEKVMSMVEAELKKNPDISVDELQKKAASINKGVTSLTARQFHARYPLQVKRRKATGSGSSKPKSRKKPTTRKRAGRTSRTSRKKAAPTAAVAAAGIDREAIRDSFLKFASDLAAAEARKDLVKVLAGVDKYVDQVVKATGK